MLLKNFPNIRNLTICDLGGSRHFWDKLGLDIPYQNITIYNTNLAEINLSINEIECIIYDGKNLPVRDKKFDLLICNSVIEHVSPNERFLLVNEMRRVAKNIFCQTPAYEFPIEPHFVMPIIHWFPRRLGFILAKISIWRILSRPDNQTIRNYWYGTKLLNKKEVDLLFPNARIEYEYFFGLTKSYYIFE